MDAFRSLDHVDACGARYTASKNPDFALSSMSSTSKKSATCTKGQYTSSKTAVEDLAARLSRNAAKKSDSNPLSPATRRKRWTYVLGFTDSGTRDDCARANDCER